MADDLLVEIGLTERQYRQALSRLEAATVKSAKKNEKAFVAANENVARSFGKASKGANAFAAGGMRNVSLQLSQVAQQGAATGNYLQALAIQLPDMAIGFGTLGIAAGVAAGALLPLIAGFVSGSDEAESFAEALDRVSDVSKNIDTVMGVLGMTVRELSDTYGAAAVQVRQFALAQAEISVEQASRRLSDQISIMDDLWAAYRESFTSVSKYESRVQTLVGTLDLTRYQARQLAEAIASIGDGASFDDQVDAMQSLVDLAESMGVKVGDLPPELQDALSEMITLARETAAAEEAALALQNAVDGVTQATAGAAGGAAALAQNMHAAAAAFSQLQAQQSKVYSGRGGDPRAFMEGGNQSGYESDANYTPVEDLITRFTPRASSRGGGGRSGGGGGVSEQTREAQRLFEATRTEAEKYAEELAKIEDLYAGGAITEETYARALDMIAEKYGEATSAADGLAEVSNLVGDALIDAAMGGENAMENLIDALKRAALQAALLGEGPLAAFFGGSGGGILGAIASAFTGGAPAIPSRDGGGFTWSGPRSGGLDGRGGQLALLHPNETVIDHTKGQSMGGTITYAPTINMPGADSAAVAKMAEVMAKDRRDFAKNVQSVIKNSGTRSR